MEASEVIRVGNVQSLDLKTGLATDLPGCAHPPVKVREDQGCSPLRGHTQALLCRAACLLVVLWVCAFHLILRFSHFTERERERGRAKTENAKGRVELRSSSVERGRGVTRGLPVRCR